MSAGPPARGPGHGGSPGHVMNGARARAAAFRRRRVVGDEAAAPLSAQVPDGVSEPTRAQKALEQRGAARGIVVVGAHPLEALGGVLLGDLGMRSGKRLVG